MYELIQAQQSDCAELNAILRDAQQFQSQSQVSQWEPGFPSLLHTRTDIESGNVYKLVDDAGKTVCVYSLVFGDDPTYEQIWDGQWLYEGEYMTIHRFAIAPQFRGQGLSADCLRAAGQLAVERGVHNLRIDTHRDNVPMQRAILKAGYAYAGVIEVADGTERLAYEKLI